MKRENELDAPYSEPDVYEVYVFGDSIPVRHCPYCGRENAGESTNENPRRISFHCTSCASEYSFPLTDQTLRAIERGRRLRVY